MILLIDNYDSFTFNLAHALRELGESVEVVRNDEIDPDEVTAERFRAVVLSPGPCTPDEAGVCVPLLRSVDLDLPVLGVCLGHQAIAVAWGGAIARTEPMHGRASLIRHDDSDLFAGLPNPFSAARYHSLAVSHPLPPALRLTARTDDGAIMGLAHRERPIMGVQFHPESILTEAGRQLLANFLRSARLDAHSRLVKPVQSG